MPATEEAQEVASEVTVAETPVTESAEEVKAEVADKATENK